MNFYAFIPTENGTAPLGTDNNTIIRNLKTSRGAINRATQSLGPNFRLYSYTNFYDNKTFRLILDTSGKPKPKDDL